MNDKNVILQKIKKILQLSNPDNNGTKEEIQNAFEMAQRLLNTHHLTMSQVQSIEDESLSNSSFIIDLQEVEAVKYVANNLPKWMRTLIIAINNITDTTTLIKRIPRVNSSYGILSIIFVGDTTDVSISIELFNSLKTTITRLSTKHVRSVNGNFKNWRSFAEGCVSSILCRSEKVKQKFESKLNVNLEIDNYIITDKDEEYIEDDDQKDSENKFDIQLYRKYKDDKFKKIREYLENKDLENEKNTFSRAKIEDKSFNEGKLIGNTLPLKPIVKISGSKKGR